MIVQQINREEIDPKGGEDRAMKPPHGYIQDIYFIAST